MGSGKSSVGMTLSQKLNLPHIDTDEDLMDILNLDMNQIFETFNEERFHALESTYFIEHIKNNKYIYSTGGGIILNSQNRSTMNKFGKTILLKSSISNLYNRLKQDTKNGLFMSTGYAYTSTNGTDYYELYEKGKLK